MDDADSSEENDPRCLIVYGHANCGSANSLRRELEVRHIPFEWRDIRTGPDEYRESLRQLTHGFLSVPTVVFPDGEVMIEPSQPQVLRRMGYSPSGLKKMMGWFRR